MSGAVFKQKYVWFYISRCGEGIAYQFFQHDATRFIGFCSIWINRLEKAMVPVLESTTLRMIKELESGVSLVDPAAKEQRDLYQIILKYD